MTSSSSSSFSLSTTPKAQKKVGDNHSRAWFRKEKRGAFLRDAGERDKKGNGKIEMKIEEA